MLEVKRESMSGWRLPGTFLWKGAVGRRGTALPADQGRGRGPRPHQLRVFDDPNRDDRGWVLSVATGPPCVPTAWPHGLRPNAAGAGR